MEKSLVTITYKIADGNRICVEVSTQVKELLEQSDRQIRSQRRQDRRHLDYIDLVDSLSDAAVNYPQADAVDLIMKMDCYRQLYTAIGKLPEVQRRRLLLHFVDNLTYRQIAELEGVNQTAISHSIKRAIIQLKKCLAD